MTKEMGFVDRETWYEDADVKVDFVFIHGQTEKAKQVAGTAISRVISGVGSISVQSRNVGYLQNLEEGDNTLVAGGNLYQVRGDLAILEVLTKPYRWPDETDRPELERSDYLEVVRESAASS